VHTTGNCLQPLRHRRSRRPDLVDSSAETATTWPGLAWPGLGWASPSPPAAPATLRWSPRSSSATAAGVGPANSPS